MEKEVNNKDKLYQKLIAKTGKTKKQLYNHAYYVENKFHLPPNAGLGYIANDLKIKLRRYYSQEIIEKIKSANTKFNSSSNQKSNKKNISKSRDSYSKTLTIKLNQKINEIKDPLLPQNVINEARDMSFVYPIIYLFENSIRNFIIIVMETEFGRNWWNDKITKHNHLKKSISDVVESRKKEEKENRFHGKRSAHEIYYTDVPNLLQIIKHYFPKMKKYIKQKQSWIETMIDSINLSRRIVAHNNPLSKNDYNRIKMNYTDWCEQLSFTKEKLEK